MENPLKMIKSSLLNRSLLITLLGFGFYFNCNSQNLIQNGSFEISTNNDCYGSFDHHTFPNPHILNNWYNFNSPDYFSSICTGGYAAPNNFFGNSYAKHGNAYTGISVYQGISSEYKEYIYQQLSAPLIAGKIYCLSFYISRADRKEYAIKQIGTYFSNSLPSLISFSYINAIPQVENQAGIMSDTTQWVEVQGCFTAQGGEQYVTIGNFNTNANTDTLYAGTNNPIPSDPPYSYYYIDDITLIDQTTVGINEINGKTTISVYPNPTQDILNIETETIKRNAEIKIYNTIGDVVFEEKINSINSLFNIGELSNGIYFYEISVNDKIIKSDKIVVIK